MRGAEARPIEQERSGLRADRIDRGPVLLAQAQLEELIEGVEIEGVRYGSIDANIERRTGANVWIELTLTEGRNRQVRRMCAAVGLPCLRLIRWRVGDWTLEGLAPGEWRQV